MTYCPKIIKLYRLKDLKLITLTLTHSAFVNNSAKMKEDTNKQKNTVLQQFYGVRATPVICSNEFLMAANMTVLTLTKNKKRNQQQ